MKLGILGTGKIVKESLPMLSEYGFEKLYILGTPHSVEKTEGLVKQYHLDGCYFDYDELLQSDVEAIYVALPNDLHYEFAKKALLAGKHVFLEKPFTVDPKEAEELEQLAKEQNRILMEAMSTHYLPAFCSLKENLSMAGDIKLVNFQFCQYSSRYDDFKKGIISPSFDPEHAGGALMDINVYNLHAALGLFGIPNSAQYFSNMERGVDTSGMLVLSYPEFQAVLLAAKDCEAPVHSMISGTKGTLEIRQKANAMASYRMIATNGEVTDYDFADGTFRLVYEFREFERVVNEEDKKKADEMMLISRASVEILDAVRHGEIYLSRRRLPPL